MKKKAFELVIDDLKGKIRARIVEHSGGVSSRIRFGEHRLEGLLQDIKDNCREKGNKRLLRME